ncbi:hypothetical protein ACJJTC_002179 [Scirpophaga incertulas]
MSVATKVKDNKPEPIAYSEAALRNNAIVVEYCRTSMSALSGSTAGVLGLTGLNGFAFYVFSVIILWIMFMAKAGSNWQKYYISRLVIKLLSIQLLTTPTFCFWDVGTTTQIIAVPDTVESYSSPRLSFFRWERTRTETSIFLWTADWVTIRKNRRLRSLAGISIDMLPLSVGIILNRRTLISAANYLEPYMDRQKDLRIWALGRAGLEYTPYRYRVWRVRRLFPRSNNPEHCHGPTGEYSPRHDIVIIHSLDRIYLYNGVQHTYNYPVRAVLTTKHKLVEGDQIWIAGSGFKSLLHIKSNYFMQYALFQRDNILDCSKFLPKWWGKFICMKNVYGFPGVQNGMALFASTGDDDNLIGLGCFEIRYNEERVLVFTDLRYYVDMIMTYANITPGDYYEYAYPKWSVSHGYIYDSGNTPYIPSNYIMKDLLPLGK